MAVDELWLCTPSAPAVVRELEELMPSLPTLTLTSVWLDSVSSPF